MVRTELFPTPDIPLEITFQSFSGPLSSFTEKQRLPRNSVNCDAVRADGSKLVGNDCHMNTFKRFGQIFWGLLIIIFDFYIHYIDVLPDFIGYILVATGCRALGSVSRHFATASVLSWVLTALSFFGWVLRGMRLLGYVNLLLDCVMIWFLLGGIIEMALAQQRDDIAKRAANRRIAYVSLMGGIALLSLILGASPFVRILWTICTLLLLFLILHLIHRAKHELTNRQASGTVNSGSS